jgi:hypothetical protein
MKASPVLEKKTLFGSRVELNQLTNKNFVTKTPPSYGHTGSLPPEHSNLKTNAQLNTNT